MSNANLALQAAAVAALQAHPALSQSLSGVFDGPPPRAVYPYISIADSLVSDWSTKTEEGREIRLALTIWDDGEEAIRLHQLMAHVEEALASMPRQLSDWWVASAVFVRSFVTRDPAGPWAGMIEYRYRLLS
jgi:hypothetical protein